MATNHTPKSNQTQTDRQTDRGSDSKVTRFETGTWGPSGMEWCLGTRFYCKEEEEDHSYILDSAIQVAFIIRVGWIGDREAQNVDLTGGKGHRSAPRPTPGKCVEVVIGCTHHDEE